MNDHSTAGDEANPQDEPSGRSPAAVLTGIVVVALVALVAIIAVVVMDADDDVVTDDGGGTTTAPTTVVPTEPEPVEPSQPAGADSALVGLTELEVRELYPLVRLVEVDGEPLAVTMDLLPGRINLAVADGVVVGATTEGCEELTGDVPAWQQQSCDPDPETDGSEVSGKLVADGDGFALEVGTGGDEYYQGMPIAVDDATLVRDTTGAPLGAQDLRPDDVVWIWVADECQESFPVQCDLAAIVVDRPGG